MTKSRNLYKYYLNFSQNAANLLIILYIILKYIKT